MCVNTYVSVCVCLYCVLCNLQLDRYMLHQLRRFATQAEDSFESVSFHRAFSQVQNFIAIQLSSFYLDVIKDRLYCDPVSSPSRLHAQLLCSLVSPG